MIATVYDTKHAIAMTADNGAEILMHISLDTVQLEGAWNVGIKDYKAHVTISSKRIHEAMDDTYYPKRHGFLRYAKTCFEHYGEYVKYWLTFNEIDSIHRHSFITAGIIPDLCGEKGETQCCYQALHHQFVAAAKAAILLRKIVPDAKIGSMITKLMTYPYTCAPEDVAATQLTVGLRILLFILSTHKIMISITMPCATNQIKKAYTTIFSNQFSPGSCARIIAINISAHPINSLWLKF